MREINKMERVKHQAITIILEPTTKTPAMTRRAEDEITLNKRTLGSSHRNFKYINYFTKASPEEHFEVERNKINLKQGKNFCWKVFEYPLPNNAFSKEVPTIWNHLPHNVVNTDVNTFKKIDKEPEMNRPPSGIERRKYMSPKGDNNQC